MAHSTTRFAQSRSFLLTLGSTDGRIHVWNANTGARVVVLQGEHTSPVENLKFNPKYMMLASACSKMNFWVPAAPDE